MLSAQICLNVAHLSKTVISKHPDLGSGRSPTSVCSWWTRSFISTSSILPPGKPPHFGETTTYVSLTNRPQWGTVPIPLMMKTVCVCMCVCLPVLATY